MAGATRTVRRVRLRGSSRAAARRTVGVLEDALRTASLPDGGGRVVLVRRLSLGVLEPGVPAGSVALRLERALARADVAVTHGAAPGAGSAPVVWFRDALDAHAALARRLASGPPPSEWFWPLAVPLWTRELGRPEAFRALAASLAERPEAPAALPAWAGALASAGLATMLARALRPADLPALAAAAGLAPGGERGSGSGRGGRPPAAETAGRGSEAAGSGATKRPPVRSGGPGPATPPGVDPGAWQLVVRLAAAGGVDLAAPRPAPPIAADGVPSNGGGPAPAEAGDGGTSEEGPGGSEPGPTGASPAPTRRHPSPGDGASVETGAPPPARDPGTARSPARIPDTAGSGAVDDAATGGPPVPAPTAAGGVLFLVGALERLDYGGWLERHPEWIEEAIARRVLAAALARSAVPPDDPAWEVVAAPPAPGPGPRTFVAPAAWRNGLLSGEGPLVVAEGRAGGRLWDASGRLLLAAWRGRPPAVVGDDRAGAARGAQPVRRASRPLRDEAVDAWGVALRRWLRRQAGVGVADVVLRPARLEGTPTHVDVHLGLDAVHLAVRRAGLDLDPEWVPWLGRVVAFHYGRGWT